MGVGWGWRERVSRLVLVRGVTVPDGLGSLDAGKELANESQCRNLLGMVFGENVGQRGSVDPWRRQAAGIVEEILLVAPSEAVDRLLELREQLLRGENWTETLDLFLGCRMALESRFYLPFYRLRSLLAARLRFDASGWEGVEADLRRMLRMNYRSLQAMRAALDRERFERSLPDTGAELRVVMV